MHLQIVLVLSGTVFSMVSSKQSTSIIEELFREQYNRRKEVTHNISSLEAAGLKFRQIVIRPPPPKPPKDPKKKLQTLLSLGAKNETEEERPYLAPPRMLPDLICLDKQEGARLPQNVSVSCFGFMCLYVYHGVGVEVARHDKPDGEGHQRSERSDTNWFTAFVEEKNNREQSFATNLETVSDELASLVGKEDVEGARPPFLAPPRILQTLICPDGSGSVALAGGQSDEVNVVRMFFPPANQIVALCLVLLTLVSVLYFATTALDASEMEELGVLDSFSSFEGAQERKLNTGFSYNTDYYQYRDPGRYPEKYRRRKRSDEVTPGEVMPEEYLEYSEYSEKTIQLWNLVATTWNTFARGWNRIAMSWNVIAIPWNVLAIVWNLALTW